MRPSEDQVEKSLDAALAMTFPASDPVAILVADPSSGQSDREPISAEGSARAQKQPVAWDTRTVREAAAAPDLVRR